MLGIFSKKTKTKDMNLIFLHGALGSKEQWNAIAQLMPTNYTTHCLDFPEHGKSENALDTYSIETLANWVGKYIESHQLQKCVLIGYSLGGYVALWLAAKKPHYLLKVITLATKFTWNKTIITTENAKLTMENLLPIKNKLEAEHGPHFDTLLPHTQQILASISDCMLNQSVLAAIECPAMLMVGENDRMVSSEETILFSTYITTARVEIVQQQPHLIQKMQPVLIANMFIDFLEE